MSKIYTLKNPSVINAPESIIWVSQKMIDNELYLRLQKVIGNTIITQVKSYEDAKKLIEVASPKTLLVTSRTYAVSLAKLSKKVDNISSIIFFCSSTNAYSLKEKNKLSEDYPKIKNNIEVLDELIESLSTLYGTDVTVKNPEGNSIILNVDRTSSIKELKSFLVENFNDDNNFNVDNCRIFFKDDELNDASTFESEKLLYKTDLTMEIGHRIPHALTLEGAGSKIQFKLFDFNILGETLYETASLKLNRDKDKISLKTLAGHTISLENTIKDQTVKFGDVLTLIFVA